MSVETNASSAGRTDGKSFLHDQVLNWDPVSFGIDFTRRLRRHKAVSHRPSLRSSIAIPRFLTARYFRTHVLTPKDYIEAAVLNTVVEDQALGEVLAREMLFPKAAEDDAKKKPNKGKIEKADADAPGAAVAAVGVEDDDDPTAGLLGDLASLDLDFDNLDSLSLDVVEEAMQEKEDALQAFDLFEKLYSSADRSEQALAELVVTFGGPGELEAHGANTLEKVRLYVREMLLGSVGDLQPKQLFWGCQAEFGPELAREVQHPWELAAVFAGDGRMEELGEHLTDLSQMATVRELGRTMLFLKPTAGKSGPLKPAVIDELAETARARTNDLTDFSELLFGLEEWEEPPVELLKRSATENMHRALDAAKWLLERFGVSRAPELYGHWADENSQQPLETLTKFSVECPRWIDDAKDSLKRYIGDMSAPADGVIGEPSAALRSSVATAEALQRTGIDEAALMAAQLCTEALALVSEREAFLPLLDEFLERQVIPSDIERVIAAGQALGVDPNEIYDRIGDAVKQLYAMVMGNAGDVDRYKRLVDKAVHVPPGMMQEMVQFAVGNENLEAMAALLAVDMGAAAENAPDEFVLNAIGYKGIGGGSNLLKQWFDHRENLGDGVKQHIKETVKDALLDLAFNWINKGEGSSEQGLIPQSSTKPYSSGDDLDSLDLESTLDAIISSGKSLDNVTGDDLFVSDSSKGQAALSVLIDISGSMGGKELAMCAIAVVMLLGKVRSEEISLAVFESDTHVIKNFSDESELDEVADKILDLKATGGTRVDAALKWVKDQFESTSDAEFRLLFLLSDFCFWEEKDELRRLSQEIADQGVVFLGAAHGYIDEGTAQLMLDAIGGMNVKLSSMEKLPGILIDTLQQIGDGAFQ